MQSFKNSINNIKNNNWLKSYIIKTQTVRSQYITSTEYWIARNNTSSN